MQPYDPKLAGTWYESHARFPHPNHGSHVASFDRMLMKRSVVFGRIGNYDDPQGIIHTLSVLSKLPPDPRVGE